MLEQLLSFLNTMQNKINKIPVVFVHGMLLNPYSWQEWILFFESKGFECHAPAYPLHDGEPAAFRKNIPAGLNTLTFDDVLFSVEAYIKKLTVKPVLIGHSMGGLLVQKLMEKNLGALAVCICTSPPFGLFSFKWSFIRSNFTLINPLKGNQPVLPDVDWFHYAVCNTITLEETQYLYNKYLVPESRKIVRTIPRVDFKKYKSPVLFIAAQEDHILPASLNLKNYNVCKKAGVSAVYKEFSHRSHSICWQNGWPEVAEFIANWMDNYK